MLQFDLKQTTLLSTCDLFCLVFFLIACGCEWLPGEATEGEEDHMVSLLWVTDVKALQEEVSCCHLLRHFKSTKHSG